MTFAQYARHRGVSKAAVTQAVRDGRVSVVKGKAGKRAIESDSADKQWHSNPATSETPADCFDDPSSYSTNRALKEHYNARLAKLEFENKSGRLVDAEQVQDDAFKIARTVRDSMLSIADRISSELAAENDVFKVHAKLTDEIRKALVSLKSEL